MPTMTPKILIVAAGDPSQPNPVNDYKRPLIPYMKGALTNRGYTASYQYAFAPFDGISTAALETAIAGKLNWKPDIILTVASGGTKAAKRVLRAQRIDIPIVFTVVSRPESESTDPSNSSPDPKDPVCPAPPRNERITGVTRYLVDTVNGAVQRFQACLNNNCNIHWCWRPTLYQAKEADRLLGGGHYSHPTPASNCVPSLNIIKNHMPPNVSPPSGGPLTGLFLIPDDLVGSCADEMILAAQDPSRNIPTFVQQLEYVCPQLSPPPPVGTPPRPSAMGGYGVMPEWVGDNAAALIDEILQDPNPDHSKDMPVRYPDLNTDFLFLINKSVVNQLNIGITVPSGARLCSQLPAARTAKAKPEVPTSHKPGRRTASTSKKGNTRRKQVAGRGQRR